ncbi:MAG: ribbon-helix-helix domain-containing protein [Burkholderiaceae bacterium]
MCQVFAHTDPILYESRTHSVRIRGMTTNVRLENLFWQILAEMAQSESMTTNQLLAKLHEEVHEFRGDFKNFASFLRVTCLRYQMLRESVGGAEPVDKLRPAESQATTQADAKLHH